MQVDQQINDTAPESFSESRDEPRRDRKRRRLAGENDTDRDMRFAREDNEAASKATKALMKAPKSSDAPLTDHKGHINLFPIDGPRRNAPKNAEAEAEAAKKKKEFEDQYTMRFSNAAGFKQSVDQKPWYSSTAEAADDENITSKDVWGNEDPRRKERGKLRLVSDDPMAIMQRGVSDLRKVERERQKWKKERDRELKDLVASQKHERSQRHLEKTGVTGLENFSLDSINTEKDKSQRHRHQHHRHHHNDKHHQSRHHRNRSREKIS